MLSKAPYPSLTQFVLALKSHEQKLLNFKTETKWRLDHHQAFFGKCGRGQGLRGGMFTSFGRRFAPAEGNFENLGSRSLENQSFTSNAPPLVPPSTSPQSAGNTQSYKVQSNSSVVCQICKNSYHTSSLLESL